MKGTAMAVVLTVASAKTTRAPTTTTTTTTTTPVVTTTTTTTPVVDEGTCKFAVPSFAIKKGARLSHFSCSSLSSSCCAGLKDLESLLEVKGQGKGPDDQGTLKILKKDLIGTCGRADQVHLYNCAVHTIPKLVPAGKEGKVRALIQGKGCARFSVNGVQEPYIKDGYQDGVGQCKLTVRDGPAAGSHQIDDVSAGCCIASQALLDGDDPHVDHVKSMCGVIGACGKQDQRGIEKFVEQLGRAEQKAEQEKVAAEQHSEVWCADACVAQGFCCNDPSAGSNQMISCAQACKMRASGVSTDSMLSSDGGFCNRNSASGCDMSGGRFHGYQYDFCQSCSDLTDKCPHGVEDKSECDFGARLNPPVRQPPPGGWLGPGATADTTEFENKSLAKLLLLQSYFTLDGSQEMLASLMTSEVEDDATEDGAAEDGSQIMTGLLGFVAGAAVTGLGVTALRRSTESRDVYNQIVA